MVCEYGMSEKLGPVTLGTGAEEVFLGRDLLKEKNYSEELAYEVDKEINRIIEEAYQRAFKILKENKSKLTQLAKELEEKEVLDETDIERILGKKVMEQSYQVIQKESSEEKKVKDELLPDNLEKDKKI